MSADTWRKLGIEVENPAGLDEEAMAWLASYLLALDGVERGLGGRAVRYVIDGAAEEVVGAVRGRTDCAERLSLSGWRAPVERDAFFRRARGAVGPLHRLAVLLDAAAGPRPHLSAPGVPSWFWWLRAGHGVSAARLDAATLAGALELGGADPSVLITVELPRPHLYDAKPDGLGEWLRGQSPALARRLDEAPTASERAEILDLLRSEEVASPELLPQLAREATSSAKRNREQGLRLLGALGEAARPALERVAEEGSAATRREAYRALDLLFGAAARSFLEARRASEPNAKARQLLDGLCAKAAPAAVTFTLPELPPIPDRVPLPEGYEAHLSEVLVAAHERRRREHERWAKRGVRGWGDLPPAPSEAQLEALARRLEVGGPPPPETKAQLLVRDSRMLHDVGRFPGLHPVHVWRLMGAILGEPRAWQASQFSNGARRANGGRPDLRELAHAASHDGSDLAELAHTALERNLLGFAPEDAWTLFAEHPEWLEEALVGRLGAASYAAERARFAALDVLAAFPQLPGGAAELAWRHAFDTAKGLRLRARAALAKADDPVERVARALGDGKQDVRTIAAEWLAELGDPAAIEPLERAVAKEKREVPRGAMFRALHALGVDLAPHLDREGLEREARAKLKKGAPAKLSWIPWASLPRPRWRSDGAPVSLVSLQWLLVAAHALKSPVPTPLLALYAERWDDAEPLGDALLDLWIARDARLPSRAEAEAKVSAKLAQWHYVPPPEHREAMIREALARPLGSAQADRGVLAFTTAVGGPSVASKIERYLKDWHGLRAPQCKMLLELLAHRPDEASTQVLLATATRFRTRGIRDEAERQVAGVAERRGWTRAELEDRTVPTAGFEPDPSGRPVLRLDLGARALHAVLDDGLAVVLERGDGKTTKTFPKPRKDDDPDRAAEAKKTFSAAKKQVKQIVRLQTARLYEAMCLEQGWSAASWREHLLSHPIVGRLCERLVWTALVDGAEPVTFRPLGDGTLTDAHDEPVHLPDGARVHLAHRTSLDEGQVDAWREHLGDYEIEPLFSQLDAEPLVLGEAQGEQRALTALEGHMVDALTLRGQLTKRGYVRGEVLDGGWFFTYERDLPSLGITAVVEFSGSPVREEAGEVALRAVRFLARQASRDPFDPDGAALPLADVPAVLRSETWSHVRAVAALGSGVDPSWEEKLW